MDVASELKTVGSRTGSKKEEEIIAAINQHKQSRYTETKEATECHIARTTEDRYIIQKHVNCCANPHFPHSSAVVFG